MHDSIYNIYYSVMYHAYSTVHVIYNILHYYTLCVTHDFLYKLTYLDSAFLALSCAKNSPIMSFTPCLSGEGQHLAKSSGRIGALEALCGEVLVV